MTNENKSNKNNSSTSNINSWRDWFAGSLGVRSERKTEIYLDLSRSATLQDTSYWLQILFSSGIAMLGMVLNSPAVVIGAMLVSPLMGPILAGGLAFASGNVILGWRATLNIVLSCALAIGFAMLLVVLLPFKEVTNEIAARTSPNTLDLFIALFSGLTGAIAVSKEVKGVATSIPGVVIAVAQMREHSLSGIKDYFKNFELPAPAAFVDYAINMNGGVPQVKIVYLSSQEIDGSRQISIADDIQARLDDPAAKVSFERIEPLVGTINFAANQAKLSDAAISLLDSTGQIIRQNPNLTVEISADKDENESNGMVEERMKSITDYLASKWQIALDRMTVAAADGSKRGTLRIKLINQKCEGAAAEN